MITSMAAFSSRLGSGFRVIIIYFPMLLLTANFTSKALTITQEPVVYELGIRDSRRQTYSFSCGHALISGLASFNGIRATEFELIEASMTSEAGITLLEFERLARSFGWSGNWMVSTNLAHIASHPNPVVMHLESDGGHFVLLRMLRSGFALLEDPATGYTLISESNLASKWSGYFYAADY